MTHPYPPPPPRKLERSRSDRFLFGVCGGVATYANLDPTLVRVLTVLIAFFTGVPVLLYLVAVFVIPEEDVARPPIHPPYDSSSDPVWGRAGAPWEQRPTEPVAPSTPEAPVAPPTEPHGPGETLR